MGLRDREKITGPYLFVFTQKGQSRPGDLVGRMPTYAHRFERNAVESRNLYDKPIRFVA